MATSENLNIASKNEELSKKCYETLNKLANLYLNAVFVFGFITDILEQDPPLQNALKTFRAKSIHSRTSAQVLIKILICHIIDSKVQYNYLCLRNSIVTNFLPTSNK